MRSTSRWPRVPMVLAMPMVVEAVTLHLLWFWRGFQFGLSLGHSREVQSRVYWFAIHLDHWPTIIIVNCFLDLWRRIFVRFIVSLLWISFGHIALRLFLYALLIYSELDSYRNLVQGVVLGWCPKFWVQPIAGSCLGWLLNCFASLIPLFVLGVNRLPLYKILLARFYGDL